MITTAREMMIAFLHGIQKEDAEGVPAEKFNYWINKAQEDWMTERSRQFDLDQKRIDDLFRLRTERIINTNGSRFVTAPCSTRIFSDGSGILVIDSERYFNLSGVQFFKSSASSGTIDSVTGEINGASTSDEFFAIVEYSELLTPVMVKVQIDPVTLAGTHIGSLLDVEATDAACTSIGIDASDYWEISSDLPIISMSSSDYRFLVPNGYPNPKYFRLLNVLFKLNYRDNPIFEDEESNWIKAELMRADQRADIYQNPYRFPTDEKPYYRLVGEFIELINETDSKPSKMKIEYLRYPRAIKYVEPKSDDVAVDCELGPFQQKEIVDMAVRMYIEATQSPRYQTQVIEEQIKDKFE